MPRRVPGGVADLDAVGEHVIPIEHRELPGPLERLEQERVDHPVLVVGASQLRLPLAVGPLQQVGRAGEGGRRLAVLVAEEHRAAEMVVVHVAEHDRVDRVGRSARLAECVEQSARRAEPLGTWCSLAPDAGVHEHHPAGMADEPGSNVQSPDARLSVHAGRTVAERFERLGGNVGEGIGDQPLEIADTVEQRQDLDVSDGERGREHRPASLSATERPRARA